MAEFRKHDPKVTGKIDQALLAALGEDVRPVRPGEKVEPKSKPLPPKVDPTAITVGGLPSWAIATSAPKPAANTDEDDDSAAGDTAGK